MNKKTLDQCMIFAAGRGERMKPLTNSIPKPLAVVNKKTLLDRAIEKIEEIPQITKIIINAYYLSDLIEDHVKSLNNSKIILSKEKTKLETGGGLINALNFFNKDKPILLINSDVIWEDKNVIKSMIDKFDENQMDILLGLKKTEDLKGYNEKGDFYFKEVSCDLFKPNNEEDLNCVFTGIQIINPKILNHHPPCPFSMNYFFKKFQRKDGYLENIKGLELSGAFFHVGTMKDLEMANNSDF